MTLRLLILGTLLSACATSREAEQGHRRTFDASSYEAVYSAFRRTLQEEGYVVEHGDRGSGILVARIEQPSAFSSTRERIVLNGGGDSSSVAYDFPKREGYEISVSLAPLKSTRVEAHLNIHRVEFFEQGGVRSSSVSDSDRYQNVFDKVRLEIERRKLMEKRV